MKQLWNPTLLQGGAPKTNLGKDTTPHTPSSVPLLMWNPPYGRVMPNDVHDTHAYYMHNAQWYQNNLIGIIDISHPSLGWAVTQINKPSMFWSSTGHNINDKVTLLKLKEILTWEFCCNNISEECFDVNIESNIFMSCPYNLETKKVWVFAIC